MIRRKAIAHGSLGLNLCEIERLKLEARLVGSRHGLAIHDTVHVSLGYELPFVAVLSWSKDERCITAQEYADMIAFSGSAHHNTHI